MNAQPSIAIIEDEADRLPPLCGAAKELGLTNVSPILVARKGSVDAATQKLFITKYDPASLVDFIKSLPCPRIIVADLNLSAIDIDLVALRQVHDDRWKANNLHETGPTPSQPAAILFDCYSEHAKPSGQNALVLYSTTGLAEVLANLCWPDGRVAWCVAAQLELMTAKTIVIDAMNVYFGMPLRQPAFVAALKAYHSVALDPDSNYTNRGGPWFGPWSFFSQEEVRRARFGPAVMERPIAANRAVGDPWPTLRGCKVAVLSCRRDHLSQLKHAWTQCACDLTCAEGATNLSVALFDIIVIDVTRSPPPDHSESWMDQLAPLAGSVVDSVSEVWSEHGFGPCVVLFSFGGEDPHPGALHPWFSTFTCPVPWHLTLARHLVDVLLANLARRLQLPAASGTQRIRDWLGCFEPRHVPAMVGILRQFRFYSFERLKQLLDDGLQTAFPEPALEDQFLLSFLGQANKSGPAVLTLANKTQWVRNTIDASRIEGRVLFYSPSELLRAILARIEPAARGPTPRLRIVFVDDFCLSSGQLFDYAKKFFQTLEQEIIGRFDPEEGRGVWKHIKDLFDSSRIEVRCVFAVGIPHPELISKLSEFELDSWPTRPNVPSRAFRCLKAKVVFKVNERTSFSASLVIQDCTPTLFELGENGLVDLESVTAGILSGVPWVQPREKEHWLQFEPYGWKDSGALVATYFNCAGNTLPVIWGNRPCKRRGPRHPLFERVFNPVVDGACKAGKVASRLQAFPGLSGQSLSNDASGQLDLDEDDVAVRRIATLLDGQADDRKEFLRNAAAFALRVVTNLCDEQIRTATTLKVDTDFLERLEEEMQSDPSSVPTLFE